MHEAIEREDGVLVGISADTTESHRRFRESLDLPFHLISDPERRIIRLYGVRRRLPFLPAKRVTYVIDKAGVVRGVYHHELAIGRHRHDVLDGLHALNAG